MNNISSVLFRINRGPTKGFERDVGNKTTYHVMYPRSFKKLDNTTHLVFFPFKIYDLQWLIRSFTQRYVCIPEVIFLFGPVSWWFNIYDLKVQSECITARQNPLNIHFFVYKKKSKTWCFIFSKRKRWMKKGEPTRNKSNGKKMIRIRIAFISQVCMHKHIQGIWFRSLVSLKHNNVKYTIYERHNEQYT